MNCGGGSGSRARGQSLLQRRTMRAWRKSERKGEKRMWAKEKRDGREETRRSDFGMKVKRSKKKLTKQEGGGMKTVKQ